MYNSKVSTVTTITRSVEKDETIENCFFVLLFFFLWNPKWSATRVFVSSWKSIFWCFVLHLIILVEFQFSEIFKTSSFFMFTSMTSTSPCSHFTRSVLVIDKKACLKLSQKKRFVIHMQKQGEGQTSGMLIFLFLFYLSFLIFPFPPFSLLSLHFFLSWLHDFCRKGNEDSTETLFMRELRRRGMKSPASTPSDPQEAESSLDDNSTSPSQIPPPSWAKGAEPPSDQLKKSRELNSEGLEVIWEGRGGVLFSESHGRFIFCFFYQGLVPRASTLVQLGLTFSLNFFPIAIVTGALFAGIYLVSCRWELSCTSTSNFMNQLSFPFFPLLSTLVRTSFMPGGNLWPHQPTLIPMIFWGRIRAFTTQWRSPIQCPLGNLTLKISSTENFWAVTPCCTYGEHCRFFAQCVDHSLRCQHYILICVVNVPGLVFLAVNPWGISRFLLTIFIT